MFFNNWSHVVQMLQLSLKPLHLTYTDNKYGLDNCFQFVSNIVYGKSALEYLWIGTWIQAFALKIFFWNMIALGMRTLLLQQTYAPTVKDAALFGVVGFHCSGVDRHRGIPPGCAPYCLQTGCLHPLCWRWYLHCQTVVVTDANTLYGVLWERLSVCLVWLWQ